MSAWVGLPLHAMRKIRSEIRRDMVETEDSPVECNSGAPSQDELAAAPTIEGWVIEDGNPLPWMYGWFFGHPELADGQHGHSAPIIEIDQARPPVWMRSESRVYKLGSTYPPAEREIRYWTEKMRQRRGMPASRIPGGGDDIEVMIAFLREQGSLRDTKIARLEEAYRHEKD